MQDITEETSRQVYRPDQPRSMAPRRGELRTEYRLDANGMPKDVLELVNGLLQADASRIGSRFTLFEDAGFIHVVPVRTRNKAGEWVSQSSVLDARITIAQKERSVGELFNEICYAVSKASGVSVASGLVPMGVFYNSQTEQGAKDEIARDVVTRMLNALPQKFSWAINYDPSLQSYYFSVETVPTRAANLQPVQSPPKRKSGRPLPGALTK
jgi:hypothetical protein